ncbi:MAG: MurT ligase domain-containing protein [Bacilli bacterium]
MVIFISKLCIKLSKIFGNHGSSIGGKIARHLDKNILKKLSKNVKIVIVITGTNGKTTTSNLIASCFDKKIIHNSKGANMYQGIVNAFLETKSDTAVLEVDEGSIEKVFKDLRVDYFVITNFFRDQLDRYSEIDMIIEKIKNSIQSNTKLILNANDPFTMKLDNNNSIYYGISSDYLGFKNFEISESKYCPHCHKKLIYSKLFYLQVGYYSCENCEFKTPHLSAVASEFTNDFVVINGEKFKHNLMGNYNIFNFCATYCIAKELDLDVDNGFIKYKSYDGRMQKIGKHIVTLAKNPSGMNLSLLQINSEFKNVLFILNDNFVDGIDISWIWDADFELLKNNYEFFVAGLRKEDMALRLKYAGISSKNIHIINNLNKESMYILNDMTFCISSFTGIEEIKSIVEKRVNI